MAWWFLGAALIAVAAGALAGLRHWWTADRCAHGVLFDRACAQCDELSCDDPAFCPPCGGPCYDEGDDDDRRLP